MNKSVQTNYQLANNIAKRWSPRAFADKPIPEECLKKILTAATWAASAFNEQPWRFIVGVKGTGEQYEKVRQCINEGNQTWAKAAPVLLLVVGKKTYTKNGRDNGTYTYDCGAAATTLALQAIEDDIYVHQMAGILPKHAQTIFNIPEDFQVLTGMALGYMGEAKQLPEKLQQAEEAVRTRKPLSAVVFGGTWGEAYW